MTALGHSGQLWRRVMRPRDPDEPHRAATVLELFFDLVFVVAVAQAAVGLEHAFVEHHIGSGVVYYAMAFFAIWWAWMNFTWFASAYDVDDVPYRLLTLLQMSGALVMAAGVGDTISVHNYTVMVAGYVLMRVAMIGQWLRAAACDPARRVTALRYAGGIAVVQCFWVGWLWVPAKFQIPAFVVFALLELAVPPFAERVNVTPWHPHHIAERYGLFTIIVLGECILAATTSVQSARAAGAGGVELYLLAGAGLVIVFAMWWVYFDQPGHVMLLTSLAKALKWGYGHLLIFASVAAVGAGLQVAVAVHRGDAELGATTVGYAVAVPVAVYLLGVGVLQIFPRACWQMTVAVLVAVIAVLVAPSLLKSSIVVIAACLVVLVAVIAVLDHRLAREANPG
ncbi:low temperature requirement protein A [Stackebrandtia nassauensis]|uniref:Low temperature requirement A n=1 Tax=Stackebrandtia nassauensis (strain DSM 44728 / CIP 108903 / NRRL B-16338 / NBRC 102104 / LLR-40K-21) TaxID=446470 RepID=D3PXY8_STANL|nr:low temperature requirement protein A [Stackebrandtia nassauensis]ADD45317.1 low temperature requirement A [Stackebrandtia nassauensis DSM 44728]